MFWLNSDEVRNYSNFVQVFFMYRLLPIRNAPHYVVLAADLVLSLVALALAYLVRFDISFSKSMLLNEWQALQWALPVFIMIKLTVFIAFKTHKGMLRYTSTSDIRRVFTAIAFSTLLFLLLVPFRLFFVDGLNFLPLSIIIVEFLASLTILLFFRFAIKLLYVAKNRKQFKSDKNVLIFGAGIAGLITKRTIEQDPIIQYHIAGFVDDNRKLQKSRIENLPIYHTDDLGYLIKSKKIDKLIIAIQKPSISNKNRVVDICLKEGVEVLNVPSAKSWINGHLSVNQLQKVRVDDLLGRDPIALNSDKIAHELQNKTVLVTGAAGSIGSGLVREIEQFSPKRIILLDQAESPLYDLQQELKSSKVPMEVVIGDVCSVPRMHNLFSTLAPEYVFHAAAYKHVPMMECNPTEAVETNVKGTKNIVDLALRFGVKKFVFISTDKAVNPTNVMGASKRIAEMYVQFANKKNSTQFVTTRFGNVLGSNGSVIPLFEKQILKGGPITVTDERVTRFFMTIPEACQLVLEAATMGQGGEVFVFDMGEPVKIIDLAKKMIALSGLKLGEDIEIKLTGLRPGEKLYEELLASEEHTIQTHHNKILIAKLREVVDENILQIEHLVDSFRKQDNLQTVRQMKAIVPEFLSNNSEFKKLDL